MRILIIDDDEIIIETLRIYLEDGFPDAEVIAYNALERGRPDPTFDWGRHDLLLLDYRLGNGENGIEWLDSYAHLPGFPPTLLLTGSDDPLVVGAAVGSGAWGYLNKSRFTPEQLVETVTRMYHPPPEPEPEPEPDPAPPETAGRGRRAGDLDRKVLHSVHGSASYRITREIGRGATSRVYLAERVHDRITVVLKVLEHAFAQEPANVQRFLREGELISQVESPYVVKIYDHGLTDDHGFIAMEFFGRGDLAQRLARGIPVDEALLYLHDIAFGLAAIHEYGIVHRDLKPANVMFRGDGSLALVDFGLSKRPGVDPDLTATGEILGTPYSMAPEQAEGNEADPRSDLYAAGVILFQMLTGRRPFTARTLPGLLMAIQEQPVPRLPREHARCQPMVDRLLAKRPEDRYQNAWDLIVALVALRWYS